MASVIAIVSKAVFGKMGPKGVGPGEVIATDRYTSSQRAFEQLGKDDAIFLVTVPSGETLWLVAIIEEPVRKGDAWVGRANTTPIADITSLLAKMKLQVKKSALAMSVQTPRVLADEDVALLRGPVGAPAAYRAAVEATPAAQRARLQAEAAGPATLRFENYRKPFAMLAKLGAAQQEQLEEITTSNRAGKPKELVGSEDWAPMELVDVVDDDGRTQYQLYLWPYGSGRLYEHDTTTPRAWIVQHDLQMSEEDEDPALRRALAAAYADAKPKLAELVDFGLDRKPVVRSAAELDANKLREHALARAKQALGGKFRSERFLLFEELTTEQQQVIREAFTPVTEAMSMIDLVRFGLPPIRSLRRWAGIDPPGLLEKRVGKWPVWKWLKERIAEPLGKALSPDEAIELCFLLKGARDDYDLWDFEVKCERGEPVANERATQLVRLIGEIVAATGDDTALALAERAYREREQLLGRIPAYATFALAVRARRRGEPFPPAFYAMMQGHNFSGEYGAAMREVIETIVPADREAFLAQFAPRFLASLDHPIENDKELDVPVLLHGWLYADLCPSERVVRGMVENLAQWDRDRDRKPTKEALEMIAKVGPICVPHLREAMKTSKSPVLAKALALFEKSRRK